MKIDATKLFNNFQKSLAIIEKLGPLGKWSASIIAGIATPFIFAIWIKTGAIRCLAPAAASYCNKQP